MAAPADERARRIRAAQYFGMVSDVDEQLGRLRAALEDLGMWGDTLVVVTSDHGEQLGDQGLFGKGGFFEASYHVVGILRHPHHRPGTTVNDFTENVDILPTVCAAVGLDIPDQCDGDPLTPFLRGDTPAGWRRAAHWEFDWRPAGAAGANQPDHLAVLRTPDAAYVHFGDGTAAAFDLAADAGWGAQIVDPATRLALAEEMLTWRAGHADRTLTGMRLG
jgi:arylsulfatase A-like enzyme